MNKGTFTLCVICRAMRWGEVTSAAMFGNLSQVTIICAVYQNSVYRTATVSAAKFLTPLQHSHGKYHLV